MRESNPQPPVLETGALPIELLAYCFKANMGEEFSNSRVRITPAKAGNHQNEKGQASYLITNLFDDLGNNAGTNGTATFTDREAQTVFHRDRADQFTTILMLSPGITISTPSGSSTSPVTSVVRK